jgi:hypothetical protein
MAINLGSAYGEVRLDASGVKKGVGDAKASLKDLQSGLANIGGAMQGIGGALSLGVTAPIVAFGVSSVKSAMDAENALKTLQTVLKSTGGASGMALDELTKMASAFQRTTKFSDEQVESAQAMLLTFTNIGRDVFPQATEAVLNMGEKFGSVEQAAIQVGKALQDPISGVTALRRVGVMLTDEQEKQIKKFMEVGDKASAQKIILKELETEFGGLATAMGETSEGKMAQFANALDDLKEKFGTALLPIITAITGFLTKLLDAFSSLPEPVQQGIIKFALLAGAVAAVIGPIVFFLGSIAQIASAVVGVVGALGGAGISMAGIGAAIGTVGTIIGGIVTVLGSLILPILLVVAAIALVYLAFKNWDKIKTIVEQLWFLIKAAFKKGWDDVVAWTTTAIENVGKTISSGLDAVKGFFQGIGDWLHTAWQNLMDWLGKMADYGRKLITNAFSIDWGQLGSNIIQGIVNGFNAGVDWLVTAATNAANAALAAIKKVLGIASPSLAMFKLGMQSAVGFALGMSSGWDANRMAKIMTRPVEQMGNQQQQFTFQFSNGLTMQMAQAMIAQSREQIMDDVYRVLGG